MSHTTPNEAVKSFKRGKDCLSDARSAKSESDWSPLQKKGSSHTSNLICTQSRGSDCSPPRKRQLNCIQPSGIDYTPSFEGPVAVAEGSVSNSLLENSRHCDALLKSSNDCEQMVRQIIRTAYQFTRHSHRQKLTAKDLEKAFKIHRVNMKLEDVYSFINKNDIDSVESGNESQPFTCTGMWFNKPKGLF